MIFWIIKVIALIKSIYSISLYDESYLNFLQEFELPFMGDWSSLAIKAGVFPCLGHDSGFGSSFTRKNQRSRVRKRSSICMVAENPPSPTIFLQFTSYQTERVQSHNLSLITCLCQSSFNPFAMIMSPMGSKRH